MRPNWMRLTARSRRTLIAWLAFALSATAAHAQTHPCDVPPVPNQTFSGKVKAVFCYDGKDENGMPTSITGVKVFLDTNTTPTFTGVPTLLTPTANATGFKQYETAYFTVPKGAHVVKGVLVNATGDGLPSVPFPFSVQDGLPGIPTNWQIAK